MPRARCHWGLLIHTREALRSALPEAHALAIRHRGEFFAGGMAPDALRLFAGWDKLSSHFYDDQRSETWEGVVDAIHTAHPAVAEAARISPPTLVWLLGYVAHVLADIAYWRHILARLPPFPAHSDMHHGAWILADQVAVPPAERRLDVDTIRFDSAPPWVEAAPVRQMLDRVTRRILIPDGMWAGELAYYRHRPEANGRPDDDLLGVCQPQWEANVAAAQAVLPPEVWQAFHGGAVAGAVSAIEALWGKAQWV